MAILETLFIGALKAALAGAVAGCVMALVCLNWDRIVNWLRSRRELLRSQKDNMAFSLQERLSGGRYRTVYGIFNTESNCLLDYQAVESEKVDQELSQVHAGQELVVYR